MSNVMFNLVGLVATMSVAYGGGAFVQGQEGLGLALLGSGSITLGFLLAFALHTGAPMPREEFYIEEGIAALNYYDIHKWVMGRDEDACWDPPIYINDTAIVPADGVFIAWINGRRALVIDRATSLTAETTTVLKPTFTDRSIS